MVHPQWEVQPIEVPLFTCPDACKCFPLSHEYFCSVEVSSLEANATWTVPTVVLEASQVTNRGLCRLKWGRTGGEESCDFSWWTAAE